MDGLNEELVAEYLLLMAKNKALCKQATSYRQEIERLEATLDAAKSTPKEREYDLWEAFPINESSIMAQQQAMYGKLMSSYLQSQ